jgi:hypothetical protein
MPISASSYRSRTYTSAEDTSCARAITLNIATGHATFEPLRERQHDDLPFAVCLGVWAHEQAVEKQEYISFPTEVLAAEPVNFIGGHRS